GRGGRRSGVADFQTARRQRQPAAPMGVRPAEADEGGSQGSPRLVPARKAGAIRFQGGDSMLKREKERVVADLVERLRASDTLIVADYRGPTMAQIDGGRRKGLNTAPALRSS